MERKKKIAKTKMRQTHGWLEQNANLEGQFWRWWRQRNRIGSPPPHLREAPFLSNMWGKPGGGQRCGVSLELPDFWPVQNPQAEERCTGVRVSSDSLPSRVHPSGSQGRRIQNGSVQGHERDQGGSSSASPETGGWGGGACFLHFW